MKSNRLWNLFVLLVLVLPVLSSCAVQGVTYAMSGPQRVQTNIFPGGLPHYTIGTGQTYENFVNVERMQEYIRSDRSEVRWVATQPRRVAAAVYVGATDYLQMGARWKLKDGREFVVDPIDVQKIANEYLSRNPIKLQWQVENRRRATGDGTAILSIEVKDDSVIVKWTVEFNTIPVDQRFHKGGGGATQWKFTHEDLIMAVIPGVPTKDINFAARRELR